MKTSNEIREGVFNYLLDNPKNDISTWGRMRELSRLGLKEAIKSPYIFGEETSQERAITWGIDAIEFLNLLTLEIHNYMMGFMASANNVTERKEITERSKKNLSQLLFEHDCNTHFYLVHLNCLVLNGLREFLKANENDEENDKVLWFLEELISDLDMHTMVDWESIRSQQLADKEVVLQ